MPIIDADTHIDETEATWEYLREFEQEYKPITQYPSRVDPSKNPTRYWLVDGHRQMRFVRDDNNTRTTVETRELLDVQKRLRDMDAMGTEVQVLYPTLFLMEATERPEVSTALRRSYNRWLADRCAESHGRLRWVCLPPLMNMDETIKELQFAKDHGACGILEERRPGSRQVACRSLFLPFVRRSQPPGPADLRPHRFRHARLRSGPRIFPRLVHALPAPDGARLSYDHPPPTAGEISQAPFRHHRSRLFMGSLHRLGTQTAHGKSRRRFRDFQPICPLLAVVGFAQSQPHVRHLPGR